MAQEAFDARYAALHQAQPFHDGSFSSWAKERSDSHPYHFAAGVLVGVADRDVTPWDDFATEVDASPLRSVAEQAPSEEHEASDEAGKERECGDQ